MSTYIELSFETEEVENTYRVLLIGKQQQEFMQNVLKGKGKVEIITLDKGANPERVNYVVFCCKPSNLAYHTIPDYVPNDARLVVIHFKEQTFCAHRYNKPNSWFEMFVESADMEKKLFEVLENWDSSNSVGEFDPKRGNTQYYNNKCNDNVTSLSCLPESTFLSGLVASHNAF